MSSAGDEMDYDDIDFEDDEVLDDGQLVVRTMRQCQLAHPRIWQADHRLPSAKHTMLSMM
jgi:hypothetical protein